MTQEELTESLDDEEEGLISEKMVKKITYLIHKLAEKKGQDFKDIQKKCRSVFKYTNLAKVSREKGHAIIDKLVELTGGEEEKQEQGATVKDDGTEHAQAEPLIKTVDYSAAESEVARAVRAAVHITLSEVENRVSNQGLGGFVLDLTRIILAERDSQEQKKEVQG
jgi:hypothetical protein